MSGASTDLGAGNNTWPGVGVDNNGNDSIFGNDGNDSIVGGNGNDTIDGGLGSDTIDGRGGDDSLVGGDNLDWVSYANAGGGVTVNLGAGSSAGADGSDSLTGIEAVLGSGFNDTLIGANDPAGEGAWSLSGGDGADSLITGPTVVSIQDLYGDAGNDTIVVSGFRVRGFGGIGNDSITLGNIGNEIGRGGSGNDTIVLGSGNVQNANGDNGDDSLVGGTGISHFLTGWSGNDTIVAGTGPYTGSINISGDYLDISVVVGNDSLFGSDNNDNMSGDPGDDTLNGRGGNDSLSGGTGNDWVSYANAGGSVTVNLGTGSSAGADANDSLTGIEAVLGGNSKDSILGNGNANTLDGGSGDDTLEGGLGADTLDGGSGNADLASYANAGAPVEVRLNAGSSADPGVASGGAGNDRLHSIENLIGSIFADTLLGNTDTNTILGGDGVDSILGGGGSDWLDFGAGDENFLRDLSEAGTDTLIGGDGNDTLDLGSDWEFLSLNSGFSLYQDQSDTIFVQGWEAVVCFAEGTRIVTPKGEDAVEKLRAGDMVLAMRDGQAGFEPLRWVGFMDIAVPRNAAMAAKTAPILIKAGAIAPGMPARDLRVSPDHALEVEGHLIPAKHLVNGSSIVQEVWRRRLRYFHLELEVHGLLLSEGTWSESYLDDGNRHAFNNLALIGLFLDFEAGRSKGQYDAQACLPVLRQGLKLDVIHGRLALRAEGLAQAEKGLLRRLTSAPG